MSRFRAALIHFSVSLAVVGAVFLAVYFLWYPEPLFRRAGGRDLFVVLALVDVTLGPLITLIIFRAGKRGLKFDLAVIAVLQVVALAYGTHVVYEARPVWIVFLKDRFDLVRANQIDQSELAKATAPFDTLPLTGPRFAAARIPDDPDEQFRIMITALAGIDVSSYPQHYRAYESARDDVLAKARPVAELRELNPGLEERVDALLARSGHGPGEAAFLPLRAGRSDLAVIVDARSGDVLQIADLRPWKY